jgi:hypothetical protein
MPDDEEPPRRRLTKATYLKGGVEPAKPPPQWTEVTHDGTPFSSVYCPPPRDPAQIGGPIMPHHPPSKSRAFTVQQRLRVEVPCGLKVF